MMLSFQPDRPVEVRRDGGRAGLPVVAAYRVKSGGDGAARGGGYDVDLLQDAPLLKLEHDGGREDGGAASTARKGQGDEVGVAPGRDCAALVDGAFRGASAPLVAAPPVHVVADVIGGDVGGGRRARCRNCRVRGGEVHVAVCRHDDTGREHRGKKQQRKRHQP